MCPSAYLAIDPSPDRSLGYWTLAYPLDIIKSAIQTDAINPAERKYKGWADAARQLWREGGVKRYTAGLTPCLARSFPANAAGFAAYEAVKKAMEPEPLA
jgi:solute carrier family 25 carnitine/acylcarnitine transporter 20/29